MNMNSTTTAATANTTAIQSTNVIDAAARFSALNCVVGGMAWHREYGDVEILETLGDHRLVRYFEYQPLKNIELTADLPSDITAEEILSGERIIGHQATVHVTSLKEMDVRRDLGTSGIPKLTEAETVELPNYMP